MPMRRLPPRLPASSTAAFLLSIPLLLLLARRDGRAAGLAANATANCTIPCGDSTVDAVYKRLREAKLIDEKNGSFCPPFVQVNPARDLTVYALEGELEMALQWTHKLTTLTHRIDPLKLEMRYRIRISTDRYFEKNVTYAKTAKFKKNTTSGSMITIPEKAMTLPKGSQALWHQHIFTQVQLYSEVLDVGGLWSQTSPDWLITSDCDREGQSTGQSEGGGNEKVSGKGFITLQEQTKKTNENGARIKTVRDNHCPTTHLLQPHFKQHSYFSTSMLCSSW